MIPTQADAKYAIDALKKIRDSLRRGKISHENAKHFAKPFIKTYDDYSRAKAREHRVPYRAFSFAAFIR